MEKATLMVCLQCGSSQRDGDGRKMANPDALALAEELRAGLAGEAIRVQLVRCLEHCDMPIAWGLRDEGKFAYTFAPAGEVTDILTVARMWLAAVDGRVPKKTLPGDIRKTMLSKLPPVGEDAA